MLDEISSTADQPSADFVFGTLATDDLRIAQLRASRSGVAHGQRLVPLDPGPGEAVTVQATTGPRIDATYVTCYYTTDGSDPQGSRGVILNGQALALTSTAVTWDTLLWGYVTEWAGQIPGQPTGTLVRYRIEAWSDHGPSHWASEIAAVAMGEPPEGMAAAELALFTTPGEPPRWPVRRLGSYAYHVDDDRVPTWLRDAVLYQIFVDRFATTGGRPFNTPATPSGFYGGTLHGAVERLDELADLGVSCLWLTPIFPSPSHHGYDATDYTSTLR